MSDKIKGYPSINHLELNTEFNWSLKNPNWYIEEKIDGSQLTMIYNKEEDKIVFYNKKRLLNINSKFFEKSISMLSTLKNLNSNYEYYGESVTKYKHNIINYKRLPPYFYIIYDIYDNQNKKLLSPEEKKTESERLGLEVVKTFYQNNDPEISPKQKCIEIMEKIKNNSSDYFSCLSSMDNKVKPEGIVLKHHNVVNDKGDIITIKLKHVDNEFKEFQKMKRNKSEINSEEFVNVIGNMFQCEGRYHKAVQHLKEKELLKNNKSDIKLLINELDNDLEKEYKNLIKNYLYTEFINKIKISSRKNFNKWYQDNFCK